MTMPELLMGRGPTRGLQGRGWVSTLSERELSAPLPNFGKGSGLGVKESSVRKPPEKP